MKDVIINNSKKDIRIRSSKQWEEGERMFRSSVTHHPTRGSQVYLPRPLMESLNFPDSVIFDWKGDTIIMRKGKRETQ